MQFISKFADGKKCTSAENNFFVLFLFCKTKTKTKAKYKTTSRCHEHPMFFDQIVTIQPFQWKQVSTTFLLTKQWKSGKTATMQQQKRATLSRFNS